MLPLDSVRVFHFSVLVMPDPPSSFPPPQLRIPSLSVSRSPAVDHFVFACYLAFYCDFDIRLGNSFFSSQTLDLRADPFSFASPRRLGCMRFRSAPWLELPPPPPPPPPHRLHTPLSRPQSQLQPQILAATFPPISLSSFNSLSTAGESVNEAIFLSLRAISSFFFACLFTSILPWLTLGNF